MKQPPKTTAQGTLETIQEPGKPYIITISLHRRKDTVRGQRDYRNALKDVVAACEQRLGRFRRRS